VLGFGRGNLNDAMMEEISNKGNGNYAYIDSEREARKVLIEQLGGTLVTIAKDVKIQVEFNPRKVAGYRLIGYANRLLAPEDFNDDTKDAGEIGAGHTVTALYEIVPAGMEVSAPSVDPLKYQPEAASEAGEDDVAEASTSEGADSVAEEGDGEGGEAEDASIPEDGEETEAQGVMDELLTLKLRYKLPDEDTSSKLEFPLVDSGLRFGQVDDDFQFAAAVAAFGMLLRDSEYKGDATYGAVLEIAESAAGSDPHGYREELVEMVRRAKQLSQ